MCYSLWYNVPTGREHRGYIIPQAVTHSLVLLKMSKIQGGSNMTGTDLCVNKPVTVPVIFEPPCNCPKHVELTGIINKPLLLHLVGCLYYLYQ